MRTKLSLEIDLNVDTPEKVTAIFDGETRDGRARYRYHIDGPELEHTSNDLKSGGGGGSLVQGMASLLSFLTAAAESYRYRKCDWDQIGEDDNASLFPRSVVEWAHRQAHRCRDKNAMNSPETQSRHSVQRLVSVRSSVTKVPNEKRNRSYETGGTTPKTQQIIGGTQTA
jgi:hypothetical protein